MSRSRTLTPSLLESLRKAALHPRNNKHPVPMGSLEDDLKRSVQKWAIVNDYLENEDGVKIDISNLFWVRFRKVTIDTYPTIGLGDGRRRLHSLFRPSFDDNFTDHINRDKMDNRLCNLRVVSVRESNINRPYLGSKTSSYRGVSRWRVGKYNYWRATLSLNGKHVCLGIRKTELEAAILYNQEAPKYHGEFAQLNQLS